jgi:hypothetical protein
VNNITIADLRQLCESARFWFDTDQLIIAGGAPRDILSGAPVKDIDIFVRMDDEDAELTVLDDNSVFRQRCHNFAGVFEGKAEFVTHDRQSDNVRVLDYACIRNAFLGHNIDIVALGEDPVDDVHNYDFGLSQVFVTPRGWFRTGYALMDMDMNSITYVRDVANEIPASVQNSKRRLERLRAKYPNRRFVSCEQLDAIPFDNPVDQFVERP